MKDQKYYVYIVTNKANSVLYTGVTNNLEQRIIEHYSKKDERSFTAKYNCCYLLYYERFDYITNAIAREKEIKGWNKQKKLDLVHGFNPDFKFLNEELFGKWPPDEITSRI